MSPIFTLGHSTRSLADFLSLLHESGVNLLADVRSIPKSRMMPHFNSDALALALRSEGIEYRHMPALGGRRHHKKGAPPSENTYWRVGAFQNYSDYAETAEFRAGLDELIALAQDHTCAIMCAEAVWWRCHRRIVTDYLLARDIEVRHIMAPGKVDPATMTPGAQVRPDGTIRYVAEPQLF